MNANKVNVKSLLSLFLILITLQCVFAQMENYPQSNRVYGRRIRDNDDRIKYPAVGDPNFYNSKKYSGINKQVVQPGTVENDTVNQKQKEIGCCDNEIPLDFAEKLNDVFDEANFIEQFIDKDSYDPKEKIFSRKSRRFASPGTNETMFDVERGAAIRPKPASCIPDVKVVQLRPEEDADSSIVYYPSCTRIKQCGGCCSHNLLSCQPVETQTITFELIKSQYTGGNKLKYIGKDIALLEEHIRCRCDCAIKEKDCKAFQKYNKGQCKCECTNLEDQEKCFQESEFKIWDSSKCQCRCREEKECTTGSYFDQNQCKCIQIPSYSRYSGQSVADRKKFILKPIYTSNDGSAQQTRKRRSFK